MLVKPNVIMNDIRLRGLAVAGGDPAGRKSPDNHAQTARNLRRYLRNAAAGARLIQTKGWTEPAADVAASLADALRASPAPAQPGSTCRRTENTLDGPLVRRPMEAFYPPDVLSVEGDRASRALRKAAS